MRPATPGVVDSPPRGHQPSRAPSTARASGSARTAEPRGRSATWPAAPRETACRGSWPSDPGTATTAARRSAPRSPSPGREAVAARIPTSNRSTTASRARSTGQQRDRRRRFSARRQTTSAPRSPWPPRRPTRPDARSPTTAQGTRVPRSPRPGGSDPSGRPDPRVAYRPVLRGHPSALRSGGPAPRGRSPGLPPCQSRDVYLGGAMRRTTYAHGRRGARTGPWLGRTVQPVIFPLG